MITVIVLIVWLFFGWVGQTFAYNYFQSEYALIAEAAELQDYLFTMVMALIGPFNLLIVALLGYTKYGPRSCRYKYVDGVRQ